MHLRFSYALDQGWTCYEAFKQRINPRKIKYATALRIGTADADTILQRFTRGNVQHPTYQALGELGRVMKTLFLCEYLSDDDSGRKSRKRSTSSSNGTV